MSQTNNEGDAVLDSLQHLANSGVLPFDMITGFTMLVEGIPSNGATQYAVVVHPDAAIATIIGHARYLSVFTERLVNPQPLPPESY